MENNFRKILSKYSFTFKKAFGQNFLTDNALLEEIVDCADITKEDTVLEIGCGAGALTSVLARRAKKVVGYEIDQTLKPILNETLDGCDNVSLCFKDILKEDINILEDKLGKEYILVANLPYYITTPILLHFLEKAKNVRALVIMVQEEVALRFTAKAGTSDYGAITVAINLRGNASLKIKVGREKFTPMPNVDSAVVKIDIDKNKFHDVDKEKVRNVVRIAFSNRRKMLINNLINGFKLSRTQVENILNLSGISLTVRGEVLSVEDFVNLTEKIYGNLK